ncbi:DUF2726 domain-containing protein [Micromonospora sp. B11E3]|uniref:DUF2726 domain-containing protein n=1 Tax=Micromonospora sp. B11E3 TaxID=3153562 RepID=UPI00325CFF7B
MTSTGSDHGSLLRPLVASTDRGPLLARGGQLVYGARRLVELLHGRPPGVTGHQWNSAGRESFDFVICAGDTGHPLFAVEIGPPAAADPAAGRGERMKNALCAAVGLAVLRIVSPTLRAADHGRRLVEYVIDARGYADAVGPEPEHEDPGEAAPVAFREIVGRLPDGRSGHVNDLGALARAAAVEAYVARRLADPIVRGLHVRWKDGPAEGRSWVGGVPRPLPGGAGRGVGAPLLLRRGPGPARRGPGRRGRRRAAARPGRRRVRPPDPGAARPGHPAAAGKG